MGREGTWFYNDKIAVQEFPWGKVEWLHGVQRGGLSISKVTLSPEAVELGHKHVGWEEVFYGLKGQSIHIVDGQAKPLLPGAIVYAPVNCMHEMRNTSGEPVEFMSIVNPSSDVIRGPVVLQQMGNAEVTTDNLVSSPMLKVLQDTIGQALGVSVSVTGPTGSLVVEPYQYPGFCRYCRSHGGLPECLGSLNETTAEGEPYDGCLFVCRFGVSSVQVPVRFGERVICTVGCGYGFLSVPASSEISNIRSIAESASMDYSVLESQFRALPMLKKNHLLSAGRSLSLAMDSIVSLLIESLRERQVMEYQVRLAAEQASTTKLQGLLDEARFRLLESRLSPHFLFNTLGTIADTAFMEGARESASMVYSLAQILRRALEPGKPVVELNEELAYIKEYLFIMRKRFGDNLKTTFDMEPGTLSTRVPSLAVQPFIENAIKHGFKNGFSGAELGVSARRTGNLVVIKVWDNGCGIPAEVLRRLNNLDENPASQQGYGIRGIYGRLVHHYGRDFSLLFESGEGKGTTVTMTVPYEWPGKGARGA